MASGWTWLRTSSTSSRSSTAARPNISFVTPGPGVVLADRSVAFELSITDQGGGIGFVEWRVNDIARGSEHIEASVPQGGSVGVKRTLQLGSGLNIVEVVAYNHQNLVASLPVSIAISVSPATPPRPSRLHVLAIGIDKYAAKPLELRYSAADARAISMALLSSGAGSGIYDRVIVHEPILDENVTRQNLEQVFEQLSRSVEIDDVFLLYLAGHGRTEDGTFYFVPHDADNRSDEALLLSSIDQRQLQNWVTRIPAIRNVLVYDTCESGSNGEEGQRFRSEARHVATEKLSRLIGRTVLAATTDTAPAREGYRGHGIFTYTLLDGLALADETRGRTPSIILIRLMPTRASSSGRSRPCGRWSRKRSKRPWRERTSATTIGFGPKLAPRI